jgi:branched-chain amino acid transport system ATP-binding protein
MLLEVQSLEAWYGASQALFGVDLSIAEGEVVALMGRNGMGKTTTIRAVCGLNARRSGKVQFTGVDIARQKPFRIARLGIGLVPEGRRCFPNLTVAENMLAAARPGKWTLDAVTRLFPRLGERHAQYASTLSGGEQQMLAIGRALMTNPKLLILDEATEGLAPLIREEIWNCLSMLKGRGQSVLVIDKNVANLSRIADRHYIIERGRTVWTGTSEQLVAEPDLQHRYLGI